MPEYADVTSLRLDALQANLERALNHVMTAVVIALVALGFGVAAFAMAWVALSHG